MGVIYVLSFAEFLVLFMSRNKLLKNVGYDSNVIFTLATGRYIWMGFTEVVIKEIKMKN